MDSRIVSRGGGTVNTAVHGDSICVVSRQVRSVRGLDGVTGALPNGELHGRNQSGIANRLALPLARLSVFMCACVCAASAVAQTGVRPVWIAPGLGVTSSAAAGRAMTERFRDSFEVKVRRGEAREIATIATCSDYVRLAASVTGAATDQEYRVLRAQGTRCLVLDALVSARPAARTLLGAYRLDRVAVDTLPARLAVAVESRLR